MSAVDWIGNTGAWTDAADWSSGAVPNSNDDVTVGTVSTGEAQVTTDVGAIASLTITAIFGGKFGSTSEGTVLLNGGTLDVVGSLDVSQAGVFHFLGLLDLENSSNLKVGGEFTNDGIVEVDQTSAGGGSTLAISGELVNESTFDVGGGAQNAASLVSAAGLNNMSRNASIAIAGGSGVQATLDLAGNAGMGVTGNVEGQVSLSGDALLEFASGQITTIAAKAQLAISGADAFVADAGALTTNSALAGLSTIDATGTLSLQNRASVTTSVALTDSGVLDLGGGARLKTSGALINSGILTINNSANAAPTTVTAQSLTNYNGFNGAKLGTIMISGGASGLASLDVFGAAGFGSIGALSGNVNLSGDSLIAFGGGQITSIAANASLTLDGSTAFLADAGSLSSNSALRGLDQVAGALTVQDGASIKTNGSLTILGRVTVETTLNSAGGSVLAVGGSLVNSGGLTIAGAAVEASRLASTSGVVIDGDPAHQGRLIVAGTAGFGNDGILSGSVSLSSSALLQFGGGQITTNNGTLTLIGANAFVADAAAPTSNSALTGLTSNTGTLALCSSATAGSGAKVATNAPLTNSGSIAIDGFEDTGGSSLTVNGKLTNSHLLTIGSSSNSLTATDYVRAMGVNNAGGVIDLYGGAISNAAYAKLGVLGAAGFGASGALEGSVNLEGHALVQFAGGEISSIAANSELTLIGGHSFIADAGQTTSNSALTGLRTIDGSLSLDNNALVRTSAGLTNSGMIALDALKGTEGASLRIFGVLTNDGQITIGASNHSLAGADRLTAGALVNSGAINLYGDGSVHAALTISGAIANRGAIDLHGDVEAFSGAVAGDGGAFAFDSESTLEFGSSVSVGESVQFIGTDTLALDDAQAFAATIKNFGVGDDIDAKTFGAGTTLAYTDNSQKTGGVLTLTDGAEVAHLAFAGVYAKANFSLGSDAGSGRLISFV